MNYKTFSYSVILICSICVLKKNIYSRIGAFILKLSGTLKTNIRHTLYCSYMYEFEE